MLCVSNYSPPWSILMCTSSQDMCAIQLIINYTVAVDKPFYTHWHGVAGVKY